MTAVREKPLVGARLRAFLFFILGVAVTLVVYAVTVAAVNSQEINERGESREPQNAANDETLAIIKDCTQPNGRCFRRGQQRTAQVLASAQRIIILSAACSAAVDTSLTVDQRIAEITSCVTARLTAATSKP